MFATSLNLNMSNNDSEYWVEITIHRIREEDIIDHGSKVNWYWEIEIETDAGYKFEQSGEQNGDDCFPNKKHRFTLPFPHDILGNIYLEIRLRDNDIFSDNDVADISAWVDEEYYDGKYDRGTWFRPTRFMALADWQNNTLVANDSDYYEIEEDGEGLWYKTSGDFDGSGPGDPDENDATVWFDVNFSPYNYKPYSAKIDSPGPTINSSGFVEFSISCKNNSRQWDPDMDDVRFHFETNIPGIGSYTTYGWDEYDGFTNYTNFHLISQVPKGSYTINVTVEDRHGAFGETVTHNVQVKKTSRERSSAMFFLKKILCKNQQRYLRFFPLLHCLLKP
jgi:hypothetical protein